MSLVEQFWVAWPWMGLGMACVMLVLLFGTNLLRSREGSRWLDPQWLAWVVMPVYLIHQFEEYALNMTGSDSFLIIGQVFANAGNVMDLSNLPLAYFPEVNVVFVWFGVPLAAFLCRWNPVIGLSPYGLLLVNGLMHCLGTLSGAMPLEANPGFWTGTFVFLPLFAVVVYAAVKVKFMSGAGLAISLVSGVLAHVMLGAGYAAAAFGEPVAALALGCFTGFSSIVFAWLGCLIFKPRFERPIDARKAFLEKILCAR